ncbi:uncharacterized protein LOC142342487 isoform X4 [Convolutriloba macropyga]|uniref:uncharacterized protein LOC142342487 isoform X4 n=1 Tax=Convolutriloba macropyga TaxID=536237 RepID=UPI003F5290BD
MKRMNFISAKCFHYIAFLSAISTAFVLGTDIELERRASSAEELASAKIHLGKNCKWETLKTAEKICECECQNGQTEDDRTDCTAMCKEPLEKALKIDNCVNLKNASFDQTNEDCKYDGFDMQRPLVTFGNVGGPPPKQKPPQKKPPQNAGAEKPPPESPEGTKQTVNAGTESEDEGGTGTSGWNGPSGVNSGILIISFIIGFMFA